MGLLRRIVDHPENRRVARVRFRDGGPDRCIGLRATRFRLATATPSTEENETVGAKAYGSWYVHSLVGAPKRAYEYTAALILASLPKTGTSRQD